MAANDLLVLPVDADHFVAVQAGACDGGQSAQVDVHFVKAVVPGHIAGQHARIRCIGVGADDGDAQARFGLHGEHAQHTHMAVATAHQHQVAQHGLFRRLHSMGPEILHPTVQRSTFGLRFKQCGAFSAQSRQV